MIRAIFVCLAGVLLADLQPLEVLEKALDELLVINSRFSSSNQIGSDAHLNALLEAGKVYFDFEEMARRSFGKIWSLLSEEQKKEAQVLLTEILARSYIGKIAKVSRNSVKFLSQSLAGDKAEVRSEVADSDSSQKTILIYRLKKTNSDWRVYDVIIDNVSLTANYRSEFAAIYDKKGYEGLINELRQKLKK
jgi:phospholipid transport system substrate-binding protein